MIEAVLFDMGGTLVHYHDKKEADPVRPFRRVTQTGLRALHERLAADGCKLPAPEELDHIMFQHIGKAYLEDVQNLRGGSVERPIRAALAEVGLDLDDGQWKEIRHLFYAAIDQVVSPREGLNSTLDALQEAGYKLGLISNTFWAADVHDQHLTRYDVIDFFPMRLYSCDTLHIKPHPAIFEEALDRVGAEPGQAVYVGDRPDVDVAGAQGAGMRGILIRSPYLTVELGDVVPDAIVDELSGLLPALERLQASS